MRSEQQYIDFFLENKETLNKSCAEGLNSFRDKAFDLFRTNGFPVYKSEEYQYTDISKLLAPDFGIDINHVKKHTKPINISRCDVPNLSTILNYIINDRFYQEEKISNELPEGVYAGSLNTFASKYPDIFTNYFGKLASLESDGLATFNTMFIQDGYVLYIPDNTVIDKPIQLINILEGQADTLVNRRILIILGKNAQAKMLICDHTTNENHRMAITQLSEIFIDENASLDFYELEESSSKTIRLTSNYIRQAASSNVVLNNITLMNGFTRNNYSISLEGENANAVLYGMAIADGEKQVDNHTSIIHAVPHCQSDQLFKYVLDEQSTGVFSGRIVVAKDAQKTSAYQNNHNLCTSKQCRMYAKPQLEIYADDVKCSHGMTTGQLDETALFYMRSRGIKEEEARLLLKFAFTDNVLEAIHIEGLKDRLKLLTEKRFRGELLRCRGCTI